MRTYLLSSMYENVNASVMFLTTAKEIWNTLNEIFKNRNAAKKLELVNKLRIEDKGYEVVFKDGKAYLKHLDSCQINKFGVKIKSLYTS